MGPPPRQYSSHSSSGDSVSSTSGVMGSSGGGDVVWQPPLQQQQHHRLARHRRLEELVLRDQGVVLPAKAVFKVPSLIFDLEVRVARMYGWGLHVGVRAHSKNFYFL